MKKIALCSLAILSIATPQTHTQSWSFTAKVGLITLAGLALGKVLYNSAANYIENRLIDETVDALYSSITLSSLFNKLSPSEREQALRKRAWLLNIRKRVVRALHARIDCGMLTSHHSRALRAKLFKIESFFGSFDYVSNQNQYEQEYETASYLDKYIEQRLVNSLILQAKPDHECTIQDFEKKEALQKRKSIIMQKLKDKLVTCTCDKVLESMNMILTLVQELPF